MKTAIEKPVTPGGVFDHLMVPQGDEPEFHPSKDPKTMTVQESLEEVDRFLCWNRMTPEEKRAEQEAQRAASHATEQAAEDIPCTMRPERVPDCWVSVKQFSKNDTATACQDWLRSTRLGRGSIKSHVRTVKVLGMGLFAFQERIHLWKGVTH